MAQAVYQKKLDELRQAFDNADADGNGRLTEEPFKQFVKLGFKKVRMTSLLLFVTHTHTHTHV